MAIEYTETFEQILKDTSPQTPGIIRELALRELRLACREFFERSYAWIEEVPGIDTPAGNVPVQIVVPGSVDANADPDFGDVVLLLSLDGVDGAVVAVDDSPLNSSVIFQGAAALTTSFKKFGTASLDATTGDPLDYLEIPHNAAFVTGDGDWTLEFFVNAQNQVGGHDYINHGDGSSGLANWQVLNSNGVLQLAYSDNGGGSFNNFPFFGAMAANGVQSHVAITRSGNDLFAHIDGVKSGATVDVTGVTIGGSGVVPINIGSRNQNPGANIADADAYIDEVRFTVGTARYTTANFTPPTEAFSDASNSADPNTEVIGILTLTLRNVRIPPIGQRPPLDDPDFTSDAPRGWFVTSNPDEFLYFPRLETSLVGETDAVVAVMPSFDTLLLPRQVTLKYYDAIVEGYLSRVYNHPNKPYSSPAVAAQLRHNFLRRIGYYMAQRKQGFNNSQQWTYPPSYNVRRLGGNG